MIIVIAYCYQCVYCYEQYDDVFWLCVNYVVK